MSTEEAHPVTETGRPIVLQIYWRVEVEVTDPSAITELAVRRLGEAAIDWAEEEDTLEEASAELRRDLPQSLAGVLDPERMLEGVPGVEMRGGRWWASPGAPSPRFEPGFGQT
jgi:hypothetical protein